MLARNPLFTVAYYLAREGTPLHKAISDYQALCIGFVEKTEALVEKFGARGAVKSFDCSGVIVSGLSFAKGAEPKGWVMDEFGSFSPRGGSEAAKDFDYVLPPLPAHYPQAAKGMKFGFLGEATIVAVRPDGKGNVPAIEGAERLDRSTFENLMDAAPKTDQNRIKMLSSYDWAPAPLLETHVFTPSNEREDLMAEGLESPRQTKSAPAGLRARPLKPACNL